ncbi:hypothetical protein [Streptomyces sp. R44]|uniref:Uncharacterized protein n=1 Tax=Streptomyces sp. R44 TaxID=3238633 RepID=A0AB39T7C0_9ACTN
MRTDATRPPGRGPSCSTENLAGHLAARAPARARLTARSVRLAVTPATGSFSHHDRALNNLPGGRRLAYRGAPDALVHLGRLDNPVPATLNTARPAVSGPPRPTPKGPPATGTHRTRLLEGTW